MGLTQSSVVQIICGDLGLDFLKCSKSRHVPELTAAIVSFAFINVSQGSVATQFRCGGIINNHFIGNFPLSVPVKEFLKSFNIWQRYGQMYGDIFFDARCILRIHNGVSCIIMFHEFLTAKCLRVNLCAFVECITVPVIVFSAADLITALHDERNRIFLYASRALIAFRRYIMRQVCYIAGS